MEASEKPQLPQLPFEEANRGSVRLVEDRIVIDGLTITDRDAARVIRQRAEAGEEPARTVQRTVEIGARVLDREDAAVEVDFVRREFDQVIKDHRDQAKRDHEESAAKVEAQFRGVFGDERAKGVLAQALEEHGSELKNLVESTFGDEGVPQKIQALIEQRNREFLERLSADDELNPLRPLLSQVSQWVRERRQEQDDRDQKLEEKVDEVLRSAATLMGVQQGAEALSEAEQRGTRKGLTFEERVHAVVEGIAAARGDVAHHTGGISAEEGGKKGDTVAELGAAEGPPNGRIVFEAKTDRNLTKPEAWRELNGAMDKRNAEYAVLVVAGDECLPSNTAPWIEYEGNKMIVTVDREEPESVVLEAVYTVARSRVRSRIDRSLQVDAAGVRDAVEEALAELRSLATIKKHLTGVTNNAENAREALSQMEERLKALMSRIDALVAVAETD